MNAIEKTYHQLLKEYGPQGWWPLIRYKGTNPTKTGSVQGYHPGDYSFPRNRQEQFEIIIGAVLTQNTSWPQVEKALWNLEALNAIDPEKLIRLDDDVLKSAIRPAGYFNQKSGYLRNISKFYLSLGGRVPSREGLLAVKGVGMETADSILLYAYGQLHFVVDAYTKRVFSHLGLIEKNQEYDEVKKLFEDNLPRAAAVYQEFHALIVEHAKQRHKKKPHSGIRKFNKQES